MKHEHENQEPIAEPPVRDTNRNHSPSTEFSVFSISSSSTENGIPVVAPAGEVDLDMVTRLRREIEHAACSASSRLIIDLAAVTFVDSAMVHLLVAVSRGYEATGGKLTVVAPNQNIRKVFEITGIDRTLAVADTLSDAQSR